MKKILWILLGLMLMSNVSFAMNFSQQKKIGSIFVTPSSGIIFEGVSYNSGTSIGKFQNEKTYETGVARWGDEENGLYVLYGKYQFNFGGKNKNFFLYINADVVVEKINTDREIVMYMLANGGSDIRLNNYYLLGKLKNGTWVKYFNAKELFAKYFGEDRSIYLSNYSIKHDVIIINVEKMNRGNRLKIGELRFKWDEKAQWFGIEKIDY